MASSYTENYGLCQWEPGDSFVRTEFNQDNARIDAALAGLAGSRLGKSQVLYTQTLEAVTSSITLDFSQLDWDEWECLGAFLDHPSGDDGHMCCTLNGGAGAISGHCSAHNSMFVYAPVGPVTVFLFPRHDKTNPIHGASFEGGTAVGDSTFQNLTALNFVISGNPYHLQSGARVILWGVK